MDMLSASKKITKAKEAMARAKSALAAAKKRAAEADSGSGITCDKHSFLPKTKVLAANGKTKSIKDVKLGDKIIATDPKTGKTTVRQVVRTITTEDDKHFVDLTITAKQESPGGKAGEKAAGEADGNSSTATLTSTVNHPFWSPSANRWIEAGDLKPGMTLRTADGGTATLSDTRAFEQRQRTHDLTIRDVHTYYVLAGATPVLVHNCNGKLADLPVHERPTRFYAKASEMLDRIQGNPATREQMYGSADAGHGGVTSLSNDDLIRFGGPNGREPITGFRDFAPGDDINLPGSRLHIADGNNRTEEIRNRVLDGRMHPDTLIEMMIGGN
ncbi:polymorphic toxin-type HINT domain-containing protein [Streptomyces sp. NRRL WC-3626]|nr:polymorphic toxin-type HINT domain-containing protein [Streptomyces sp. NRRL WC-3626]